MLLRGGILNSSAITDMSFRLVEDHCHAYPIRVLCSVLEVSPAGYYAWRARAPSARSSANAELVVAIRRVHHDSGGRYGSPHVHAPCGHRDGAQAGDRLSG